MGRRSSFEKGKSVIVPPYLSKKRGEGGKEQPKRKLSFGPSLAGSETRLPYILKGYRDIRTREERKE